MRLWLLVFLLLVSPAAAQQCLFGQAGGGPITFVQSSNTGAGGAVTATLPGVTGKVTSVCGFVVTSGGGATAASLPVTVSGIATTMTFQYVDPSTGQGVLGVALPTCIPASAANTPVVVTKPAGGTATASAVSAWGCQQ